MVIEERTFLNIGSFLVSRKGGLVCGHLERRKHSAVFGSFYPWIYIGKSLRFAYT